MLLVVKKLSMVVTPNITLSKIIFNTLCCSWWLIFSHNTSTIESNNKSRSGSLIGFGSSYRAGVASYSIQKVKKEDMTSTKPEKAKQLNNGT